MVKITLRHDLQCDDDVYSVIVETVFELCDFSPMWVEISNAICG